MQRQTPPFEFDGLAYHYSHCFYSQNSQIKDPAFLTFSKLILAKFDADPQLSTLI
jgi:hypothetical protein